MFFGSAIVGQSVSLGFNSLAVFSGVTSERSYRFKQTAAGFTWKLPEAIALTVCLIGVFLPP